MRILLVNKFYFPQGGADKQVLQLEKMLTEHGHQVAIFAMAHPHNLPSPWSKHFVSNVDFSRVRFNWQGLRVIGRTLHSFEAARKMAALLTEFRPDVVHIHNIYHQISPSILPVIARRNIPIVQTLHDYALVSENYSLYAHGGICQHGRRSPGEYILHRCIKNSLAASALAALDRWWHHGARPYEKYVQAFISPSRFLKDLVVDWTGKPLPITVVPNFVERSDTAPMAKDGSVLYLGRLSAEKGVATLIRASRHISAPVNIVGVGPMEAPLKKLAVEQGIANVRWHGFKIGGELTDIIGRASVLVVPSEWYENCPLVILEAFARGTPVVASRIGGMPELVHDGENGRLFTPGDASDLAQKVNAILASPEQAQQLGAQARHSAQAYTPGGYMEKLLSIYASTISR